MGDMDGFPIRTRTLATPEPGQEVQPAQPRRVGRLTGAFTWFLLLPMFFQIYHYKAESGPLYALSKIWPVLLAPLVLLGMLTLRLPDGPLYLAAIAYSLVVPVLLSMIYLPNGLVDALLSTIKAWPFTFFFSFAALLWLLRPSEATVKRGALAAGIATYAVMLLLWVTIPAERYQPGLTMFSWDEGRGSYIRMPMMLGVLAMFWLGERFVREWRMWQLVLAVGAVVSMGLIYRARLPTGVCVLLLLFILASPLRRNWRWGLGALAALPLVAGAVAIAPDLPDILGRIFDASLFIRIRSSTIAWEWITSDPVKLLLGSGSISSFSEVSLADFFGNADFWLTDIGWLGVVMEYGLVGTALIVALHLRALTAARAVRGDSAFRAALADYVLFEILCSAVYSVMYAPGPVVTVAALAWWLRLRDAAGMAEDQPGWPVAAPRIASAAPPAWAEGRIAAPSR